MTKREKIANHIRSLYQDDPNAEVTSIELKAFFGFECHGAMNHMERQGILVYKRTIQIPQLPPSKAWGRTNVKVYGVDGWHLDHPKPVKIRRRYREKQPQFGESLDITLDMLTSNWGMNRTPKNAHGRSQNGN